MVAKSLPIKSAQNNKNSQHLSAFGQNIYSHINQKQWGNNDGVSQHHSLGKDHHLIQSKRTESFGHEKNKVDPNKNKYYYSLDNEL